MKISAVAGVLFVCLMACGDDGSPSSDGGPADALAGATLEIGPADATILVIDGVIVDQPYKAVLRHDDGTSEDVTAETVFSIDNISLGNFTNEVFHPGGGAGGIGTVNAGYNGLYDTTSVTIQIQNHRVADGAPADAPDWFDGATEDAGLAPSIVYPSDKTIMPPNIGDFEVHWMGAGSANVFEVALKSDYVDLRVYAVGPAGGGAWTNFLPEEWAIAGRSNAGDTLTITVRGMDSTVTTTAGTSTPFTVDLTEQEIRGGIYYWMASGTGAEGFYRHDMSRPGEPAEEFYTTTNSPSGRCVACHSLSRDGSKMLLTLDGGNGEATMIDVATRMPMLPLDSTLYWNFAAFEPGANRFVAVTQGVMNLRSAADGSVISAVPTGGTASHPDFSPNGDAITYVQVGTPGQDWHFTGGSVVTQSFDPGAGTFGSPVSLVTGGQNSYYPTYSPDGQWILFNRSNEDAYDDASAELWVVKADGTVPAFKLELPNVSAGLYNSWPRWAPFEQTVGEGANAEPLFWFTFSSRRAFGVRMAAGTRPQIWMAPFFPNRVGTGEPSGPAFRLPFQNLSGNNHTAQWTETIVPVD